MQNIPQTLEAALLERVVGQIARQFHPDRVILFGSHARGDPTADSDVDLLVVLDTAEPLGRCAARISAAVDHPFPLDIIVRTPGSLADAYRRGATFVTEVLTQGVVLCDARDERVAESGGELSPLPRLGPAEASPRECRPGSARGPLLRMAPDFDAPLEDFAEYSS